MSIDSNERKQRILTLIDKFRKGEASEQEKQEIDEWYETFQSKQMKGYTDGMTDAEKIHAKDKLLHRINRHIYQEATPQRGRKLQWKNAVLPSVILMSVLAFGIYYAYQNGQDFPPTVPAVAIDADPGGNRAVLILGNGRRVDLADAPDGQLVRRPGIQITKTTDGQLVYEVTAPDDAKVSGNEQAVVYNSIETPNGGQYQIVLPDGSKVWLNAASSLRYPASFGMLPVRRVELSGEAYFEIARDESKPFLVNSGKQTVKVLGTHFNVNAYDDEPLIKTTLLEGRIQLSLAGNASKVMLSPGEEAVQKGPGFIVREADVKGAVAWKDGVFMFNSTDLQTLMRQLARWYDVEVVYEGDIAYKRFFGSIERSYALSEVLKVLKLGNVNFRLEQSAHGKTRLVVLPADQRQKEQSLVPQ